MMSWLRDRIGGTVKLEKRSNPRHKPVFRWYVGADELDAIVRAVVPYLIVKKRQAELVIAYGDTLGAMVTTKRSTDDTPDETKHERFRIHDELRALNKRGAA